jgi:hypothetical protein
MQDHPKLRILLIHRRMVRRCGSKRMASLCDRRYRTPIRMLPITTLAGTINESVIQRKWDWRESYA